MDRRDFLRAAVAAAAVRALPRPARAEKSAAATLRVIHTGALSSLDPIWTTSPSTHQYGFLTFDQLVAVDSAFVPRPQMAEGWTVENGGRRYVFALREGLKFHNGEPVRAQDCVPSIRRWATRDSFGQAMMRAVDAMAVIDDRRFSITLQKPFPLLPAALGKSNAPACFIMPAHMAAVDPMRQVTETIGSGPFRFLKEEWMSGSRAAWARFEDYVPRKEPVSGIAGGRNARVARVEWSMISDAATAMASLQAEEQDYWDIVPGDLLSTLAADAGIRVRIRDMAGYMMLQFNHLQPPFNDPAIRRAVAMAVDQTEFLRAAASDPKLIKPCYSFYPLESPYVSEAGADILKVKDPDKARAALKAAGYQGGKVVILGATDTAAMTAMGQVAEDLLRRLGMSVELVPMDFATMIQRRASKAPVEQGGWSLYLTGWTGADILTPAVNSLLRGAGTKGWWGWADDPALEALRDQWFDAAEPAAQARLATEIQQQAFRSLPYIPLGAVAMASASRSTVTGLFPCPVAAYWNIGKIG